MCHELGSPFGASHTSLMADAQFPVCARHDQNVGWSCELNIQQHSFRKHLLSSYCVPGWKGEQQLDSQGMDAGMLQNPETDTSNDLISCTASPLGRFCTSGHHSKAAIACKITETGLHAISCRERLTPQRELPFRTRRPAGSDTLVGPQLKCPGVPLCPGP